MDTVSVTKFLIKGKTFYLKLEWKENENELFNIKVYDGDHTWSGRFSNEFAEKYRDAVNENKEEYYKNIKTALTGKTDEYTYDFALVPGETESATFSWKKQYQTRVRVHGSTPVHQDHKSSNVDIIDFLLNENVDLRKSIVDLSKRNNELSKDLDKCKSELEAFVNLKTSLEATLYGKFVTLLNAKKRRIKLLEENLNSLDEHSATDSNLD